MYTHPPMAALVDVGDRISMSMRVAFNCQIIIIAIQQLRWQQLISYAGYTYTESIWSNIFESNQMYTFEHV